MGLDSVVTLALGLGTEGTAERRLRSGPQLGCAASRSLQARGSHQALLWGTLEPAEIDSTKSLVQESKEPSSRQGALLRQQRAQGNGARGWSLLWTSLSSPTDSSQKSCPQVPPQGLCPRASSLKLGWDLYDRHCPEVLSTGSRAMASPKTQ